MKKNTVLIAIISVLLFLIAVAFIETLLPSNKKTPSQDDPPVSYDQDKTEKMLKIEEQRPPLSQTDKAVRSKLISYPNRINEDEGAFTVELRQTSDYAIEYVSAPDDFEVEILTTDIDKAKNEATAWLLQQGLSNQGICNLPVSFYLNHDIAESLRDKNILFDPLPPGC